MPKENKYQNIIFDDEILDDDTKSKHGKKYHQKLKPYLVLQYLMHMSDVNNAVSASDLVDYLKTECRIFAERRSIYRDIEEINLANVMIENDCDIQTAAEMLAEDDELELVVYDKSKKGFYVRHKYDITDIRLLAECIYSAKFLTKSQSELLIDTVCNLVSDDQADRIKHNALLVDRVKTNNKQTLANIAVINDAMSREIGDEKHTPEKISFKYLRYSIDDITKQVERKHGATYTVSPFQLIINDGNYYLMAFDDNSKQMRTYRVDRMKDVSPLGIPREGMEEFKALDVETFATRAVSMYSGKSVLVTMSFISSLLDTAIERFGTKNATYRKVDDNHFEVSATVDISDQFFGWLLGFGKRVKLISPDDITEQFKEYLDKVREMYE